MHRCTCHQYLSGEVHGISGIAAPTRNSIIMLQFLLLYLESIGIREYSGSLFASKNS